MEDEYFGPALPPTSSDFHEIENKRSKYMNEQEPRKRKHSQSSLSSVDSSSDSSTNSSDEKCVNERAYVPEVYNISKGMSEEGASSSFIGPVMPNSYLSKVNEDDMDEWGPKPPSDSDDKTRESTAEEIERRAERMKHRLLNPVDEVPTKPGREIWMTELPPERGKHFGLTARKFCMATHSGASDRSVWTETPVDRAKRIQALEGQSAEKSTEKITLEHSQTVKRDLKYSLQVEEYNKSKKRSKSLLELHNEKKKEHKKHKKEKHKEKKKKKKEKEKKSKKDGEALKRRPFDRDVDLKVNRLDDAQRAAIIKRSQQLAGRFGHGNTSGKFL